MPTADAFLSLATLLLHTSPVPAYCVVLSPSHSFGHSGRCITFMLYAFKLASVCLRGQSSLVSVGCQLRSWVGREFILFYFFILFFQWQRVICKKLLAAMQATIAMLLHSHKYGRDIYTWR